MTLKVWNLLSGECLLSMKGHRDWITAVVSVGSRSIVSGSEDETIKMWDISSGECVKTLCADASVHSMCLLDNGKVLVAGDVTGGLAFWDMTKEDCSRKIAANRGAVLAVATPMVDGVVCVVSAGSDNLVVIWS